MPPRTLLSRDTGQAFVVRGLGGAVVVLLLAVPLVEAGRAFDQEDATLIRHLGELVMAVDGWSIYACVDELTQDAPYQYRLMGTPTHQLFLEKYGSIFTDRLRLQSHVVPFSTGGPLGQTTGGDNILAVYPGRDLTRWVVIGGHYDTRELTLGGGALDNTSGICTVFEIAKAFVELRLQPEATVVFAWWDGEEWGLHGSRAFLKDHNATKQLLGLSPTQRIDFVAATSFDMVGLNYPAYNTWIRYGEPGTVFETAVLNVRTAPVSPENFTLCASYGCYRYDAYDEGVLANFTNYQALVREVAYRFLDFPPRYVWVYDDEYGRSDHVPFIAAGIPGMRVQGSHDEEYPHYHMPTDTLAALTVLAGDETHLRSGFDKAADVGALTLGYVALTGHVGHYGTPSPLEVPSEKEENPTATTPGLDAAVGLLAASAVLFGRRRRR